MEHKKAIGWTLTNILDISSSMCMHHILLEDEEKAVRKPQRRLNPLILDVIKNAIYIALEDKEKIDFTCSFDNLIYRRIFFDFGIKSEDTDKNFKVTRHNLKLFH